MEYFGSNPFVMNILQATTPRKQLNLMALRAGKGEGGVTPSEVMLKAEEAAHTGCLFL
jgi:hypothetical protein